MCVVDGATTAAEWRIVRSVRCAKRRSLLLFGRGVVVGVEAIVGFLLSLLNCDYFSRSRIQEVENRSANENSIY